MIHLNLNLNYTAFTMSWLSVITLANSIIGVAILSMPYCFKQCGIILAIVMILCSGMLVKVQMHNKELTIDIK